MSTVATLAARRIRRDLAVPFAVAFALPWSVWITRLGDDHGWLGPGGAAGPELRSVLPCAHEAKRRVAGVAQPQFGDLPMAVLSSHAWGGEDRVRMHRGLAARSRASSHRVLDDRFHDIHMAHPDAVVGAVQELLAAG
jgi:hypothetical protein